MKKRTWLVSLTMAALIAAMAVRMIAAEKGTECKMTGMLICAYCNLADPEHKCSKECCQKCIEAGSPVVLKDDKGQLFLCVGAEKEKKFVTPEVFAMLGGKVKVEGMLVKNGGLQGIYVNKIEKAS